MNGAYRPCLIGILLGLCATTASAAEPSLGITAQTADLPSSWLVLYNLDVPQSIEWALWYQAQRSIPDENMVGLHASASEDLPGLSEVQFQLISPVRNILAADPELDERVMGILLGYGLPGYYSTPPLGGPGGFSVADAFQDMDDDDLAPPLQQGYNLQCPHFAQAILPLEGRLTRDTLAPGKHIVARIDAPTLELAKAMTLRAKSIEAPNHFIDADIAWFDYTDTQFSGGVWPWLRDAVTSPFLGSVPWREFDSDTEGIYLDAFRIDTHDVTGWNNGRLHSKIPGSRIFAYNFNSWGATTVRSTTNGGGRFVPNAIAEGYAAAIGSTGEPQFQAPFPKILVACLAQGWTLGESFYLSNPLNDWMWTLIGDPFLRVPNWFDVHPLSPIGSGDINADGRVDGADIVLLTQILMGAAATPEQRAAADMTGDGLVNDDDAFLILGPTLWESSVPDALRGTGDVNNDGHLNGDDVNRFSIMVIDSGQTQWPLRDCWAGDMNHDGRVDANDITEFLLKATNITFGESRPPEPNPDPDP